MLICAAGGGSAQASPARPHGTYRATLTILITARGSAGAWGKVIYHGGVCASSTCGIRLVLKSYCKLTEVPVSKSAHPFLHWVLPDGKTRPRPP